MNKNELVSWIYRELCKEEEEKGGRPIDWHWNNDTKHPVISVNTSVKKIALPFGMTDFRVPAQPKFVEWSEFRRVDMDNNPPKILYVQPMAYDEETNTLYKIIYE